MASDYVYTNTALIPSLMGPSWYEALKPEFSEPYFVKLWNSLAYETNNFAVYPPADQVFFWTKFFPIDQVKVVIIGQDPYYKFPGQAHGLAFSVPVGVKIPPSLVNIFKELTNDIPGFQTPGHGNLNGWAQQGVLLLNACLTVRASKANSHAGMGWEEFTDAVIAWINMNLTGVVFMLWGAYAQKKGAQINTNKHFVLTSAHPSPLSAYKGFLGCQHFSMCNYYLMQQNKTPINWSYLPPY